MKRSVILLLISLFVTTLSCMADNITEDTTGNIKINIICNGHHLSATLYNNTVAKDFAKRLPLTIYMDSYDNALMAYDDMQPPLKYDSVETRMARKREIFFAYLIALSFERLTTNANFIKAPAHFLSRAACEFSTSCSGVTSVYDFGSSLLRRWIRYSILPSGPLIGE